MKDRESPALAAVRWARLKLVQQHYDTFVPFLEDVMEELGFHTSEIQRDIAGWMEFGPQYIMVQAQRGQAKTTIAAAYAVWCLLHSPAHRVLVVSAGGTQAVEISTLIVRIIMNLDVLECMRPDKMAGDRTSTEAFDVHHSLKGIDKSPSVACVGIDSNLQGKRADLLIPDDVESGKNSATAVQRAKLLHITKDFTSINSTGRIIWLGTPQTLESIYNSLAARGVAIRIWPGRFPTDKQMAYYGSNLAPYYLRKIAENPSLQTGGGLLGDQGQPVDPVILPEDVLQKKELDQGEAYFQLQHMLNVTLSDAMRFPLKPHKLTVFRPAGERFPLQVVRGMGDTHLKDYSVADFGFKLTIPHEVSVETSALASTWAYVDPAPGGANADETAYAIGGYLNGTIFLLAAGGIPGGYDDDKMERLAQKLKEFKVDGVTIEKNMGYGAFRHIFTPILRKHLQCQIEDDLVTGMKEARIINTLSPIMGRGALVVSEDVVEEDQRTVQPYMASMRQSYSLFYQLAKMNLTPNALIHDDRVDALEGLCRHFQEALAKDSEKGQKAAQDKAWKEFTKDPLGHNRCTSYVPARNGRANMLRNKRR